MPGIQNTNALQRYGVEEVTVAAGVSLAVAAFEHLPAASPPRSASDGRQRRGGQRHAGARRVRRPQRSLDARRAPVRASHRGRVATPRRVPQARPEPLQDAARAVGARRRRVVYAARCQHRRLARLLRLVDLDQHDCLGCVFTMESFRLVYLSARQVEFLFST